MQVSHVYFREESVEILTSQKIIEKGEPYKQLHPWLGQGLLVSSGELWRSRRKLLTPAFHFSILNNFVEVFNEQSLVLCGIFEEICQSSTDGKGEIDVDPYISRCSLDMICEAAMGTKINAQTENSDYVRAVYRMGQLMVEQYMQPWLRNPTIFSLSSLGREHNRLLKTLHGFTKEVIHRRREIGEILNSRKHLETKATEFVTRNQLALLDLLLTASVGGQVLSDQDIQDEIDTFMFEGHDTSASMMGWFLYLMAANPECQGKAYNELLDVFGKSERECTQEDIPKLKYLECCIKETLRMYPSIAGFERHVQEDIRIGNYLIPAGCSVGCLALTTHTNSKFFPDPLVFKPERFLLDQAVGRHPYAYIPFSAGPRNCIGQRFAMLEGKIVISNLLRRFKFEQSPNAPAPIPSFQITLKSLTGIHLSVSCR
ncbi:hypothetical protein DAPPUDRAFT_311767 [Daphnia pulex]|uniref:Cytochrome P450 n=1 Tax=Daphnia pulex TaxID=6669 RepID=E9FXV1_DAPPU|nr:hypothetical protein DAPPUDRAFT_311767 [Daphnia pulex]|eukprot:EFX88228.1 hypothetical protein DAPPUDRAFT_311767 [Daphnia pulex]